MAHITFPLDRAGQSSSGAGLCLSSFVSFMELSTEGYSELLSGNRDDPLKFNQIMLGFLPYFVITSGIKETKDKTGETWLLGINS